jgi:hypothetical protein
VSNGYTIIEVIIFLGITMFLLTATIGFLNGSEGHNRFSQSMRDMQSKIQDWINDVPTGFAGGQTDASSLNCRLHGSGNNAEPRIFDNGNGNDKPNCIFLGKVIQFTDSNTATSGQDSLVYAYSVFGIRTYTPSGQEERPVASLDEANPITAVGKPPYSGTADLTETYPIFGGAKVKKIIKSSGIAGEDSHIAGFFLSFNGFNGALSSGSSSVTAYQYPLSGNQDPGNKKPPPTANDIDNCISLDNSVGTPPNGCSVLPTLSDWEICFYNDSNSDQALLTISSAGGLGATTKLEFKSC